MTVNPKLRKMFESLNENDLESARSLFHDVVVEMSKEIYKEMDEEDFDFQDDDAMLDPDFDDEEFNFDVKTFLDEEGDEVEDLKADLDAAETGDELSLDADFEEEVPGEESDSEVEELEDRIEDIESAFEELKAKFDEIVNDDEVEDTAISDLDVELEESVKTGKNLNVVKNVKPKKKA